MDFTGLWWKGGLILIVAGASFEIFCRWWVRRQRSKRRERMKGGR